MDEIVGRLVEARKQAKLSLEDIHTKTKIPLRQLEYLEAFEYDKMGPAVYVKGFIRRYAQVVGIDPDTLWEQEISEPIHSAPRSTGRSIQPMRFDFAPFLRIGAVIALVVIVGILIRAALLTYLEPSPPAPPDVPPQDEPAPDDDQDPPVQEPQVSVDQIQADDTGATYIVRNADILEINVEFSGSCWTRITADGKKFKETTYRSGQTDQFSTAQDYRFRFGAPLHVSVTVNGVKVELPDIQKGFNLVVQLEQKTE